MMNAILCGMLIFSMIAAAFQGKMEALSTAALTGCGEAITLILSLAGMLCLWSGLMEIARRCRLTQPRDGPETALFNPFTASPSMPALLSLHENRRDFRPHLAFFCTLAHENGDLTAISRFLAVFYVSSGQAVSGVFSSASQCLPSAPIRTPS